MEVSNEIRFALKTIKALDAGGPYVDPAVDGGDGR
jgi:hypothetical protein